MVETFELGDRLFRQRNGRPAVAAVEGRLAAAGLPFGNDHLAARRFKQPDGSKTDARTHQVDKAGIERRLSSFAL